jgi:hypothetical protein
MKVGVFLVCLLASRLASAQAVQPVQATPTIDPDRPDITNGAQLVEPGALQLEAGGSFTRNQSEQRGWGSPFTLRLGVTPWIEARFSGDGLLVRSDAAGHEVGFGNVQLAAKVRVWADRTGASLLSVLPTVNLPTADAGRGFGSGSADYTIAVLTGADIGARAHADVNYGIGAIGSGGVAPHFAQQTASISTSVAAARWSPYGELFWISRQEPDGSAIVAVDAGAIYTVRPHIAVDGGVQLGVSASAPDVSVFAGVSIIVGHISFIAPRSRFKSSGERPNRLPMSRTVSSRRINATPTASIS